MYTNANMIKEIRRAAKSVGLTFRRDTGFSFPAYELVTRGMYHKKVYGGSTLVSAYEDCCSGYISSWDGESFHHPVFG